MKALKISIIILVVILIIMAITNPSYSSFKEYSSELTTTKRKSIIKRVKNYLIFSIYEKQVVSITGYNDYEYAPKERYLGILMNFYPIKEDIKPAAVAQIENDTSTVEVAADTTVSTSSYPPTTETDTGIVDIKEAYEKAVLHKGVGNTDKPIDLKEAYDKAMKSASKH